ncbi:MAG: response regulator transcription factor [Symbiopectobacterium sp.]|uniref:response regulator transcription factor n=1 Tax=Symbiopectobacterium sp. TaxID=2952789 RepID=UPI003F346E2D
MLSQSNEMFTDREWDVLFLSLQRLSCKEIAKWLAIAIKTVEVYLDNIYRKAEVHHAHQLRQFCQEKVSIIIFLPNYYLLVVRSLAFKTRRQSDVL